MNATTRNLSIFLVSASILGLSTSCSKEQIDPELEKRIVGKLENIEKRLDRIEAAGGVRGAAAERGQRARPERPPGPDATTVYAVPTDDATYRGPKYAKVTMIEAFDFA